MEIQNQDNNFYNDKPLVKRPVRAIIASIIAVLNGIYALVIFGFGLWMLYRQGADLDKETIEGMIYIFFFCILLITGGILILLRKYLMGSIICLCISIFFCFIDWQLSIGGFISAMLCIRLKDKIEKTLMKILIQNQEYKIRDIAAQLKRTEADIELAIRNLQKQGTNILFDTEKRLIKTEDNV